jgi:hypothetical protein
MDTQLFEKARWFLYQNARLLERRVFEYAFENGPRQAVIAAVKAYQNPDGGFGNAIEADLRTPHSQPVATQFALTTLDRCGAICEPEVVRGILPGVCNFLSAVTTPEGGVPFVLPTANAYPHTPWMGTDQENPPALLNPTAELVGLLLKSGVQHPWIDGAAAFCWEQIEAGEVREFHTAILLPTFLAHVPDRDRAERALARLMDGLAQPGVIEMDPAAPGYVQGPLDWAPYPNHPFRKMFKAEDMALHLAALQSKQQPDGGWNITWSPVLSPAVEMEWRGVFTLEKLRILRAYEG